MKIKPIALLIMLSVFSNTVYADIEFSNGDDKVINKNLSKNIKKTSNQNKNSNKTEKTEEKNIELRVTGFNNINPKDVLTTIGLDLNLYNINENNNIRNNLLSTGLFQNVQLENVNNILIINVIENPLLRNLKIDGAKVIKKELIEHVLDESGIKSGSIYNEVLLNNFKGGLLNEYNNIGKKHATVDINVTDVEELKDVDINIKEGKTSTISKIVFIGNENYKDKKLKHVIDSTESSSFSLFSQTNKLDLSRISEDAEKIIDFYNNNGYLKANIKDVKTQVTDEVKLREDLIFEIEEGEQYHYIQPEFNISSEVSNLITQEKLLKLNKINDGKLYKKNDVLSTSQGISYLLSSNGYAFNKVDIQMAETNDNNNNVKFIFNVDSGNKAKIGNITVSGNKKTKEHVITRELRQKTDDEFDISKINRSKERLNLTGYFYNSKITPVPNENGDVDLNVEVEERRTGNIEANIGYTQDYGITYGGSVSDVNFMGSGKAVLAKVSNSSVQKNAEIKFSDPFLTDSGISLDSSIYGNVYDPRKYKSDYQNYKTDKYGVNFVFGVPINEYDRIYLGIGAEKLKLSTYGDAPKTYRDFISEHTGEESGVGKYSGTLGKATIGWGRNKTNHAIWPTKGYIVSTRGEVTVPGSGLQFYKLNADARYLHPIGEKSAISFSGKIGYANSYGKTKKLPFFENYYSGGLGSVRGFETSTLGPKVYDRNNSIVTYGGNKMLNASIEFLTPLPFVKDSSNVRLSAFVDVGTVWDGNSYTKEDSDNDVSVYEDEPVHRSTAKNELRAAAGVAYTWLSPIGPLKFSYAIPLKKKKEDELQRFQFQIGSSF